MEFGTMKSGGDVNQVNFASQGNASVQDIAGAASAGPAILNSVGGVAAMKQFGAQVVGQQLLQGNLGVGGDAGHDNNESNTSIHV